MSNADRCARRLGDRGICGVIRSEHYPDGVGALHAFVEPAPQPEPSGDEAAVREIARAEAESIATRWVPAHMTARQGMVDDIAASLVRYRALGADTGKADGAREERKECELTIRDSCICQGAECACSGRLRDIARAIVRRGSKGT